MEEGPGEGRGPTHPAPFPAPPAHGRSCVPGAAAARSCAKGTAGLPAAVAGGANGVIIAQGGRFGGYGLFLSKGEFGFGRGKVVFLYNLLDLKRTTAEPVQPLSHVLRPIAAAHIAWLTAAPLPARGPPQS